MSVSILQLLSKGTGSLHRTRSLKLDDLDEIRDPAQIIFLELLTGEPLNRYGNGRIWFLLLNDSKSKFT